jgi:hypothetical protein
VKTGRPDGMCAADRSRERMDCGPMGDSSCS